MERLEAAAGPDVDGGEDRERGETGGEPAPREIDSRILFGAGRVVTIRHGRERYTLRVTRAGKLILTK
jgi:hemin uptake protein HemP